MNEAVLSFPFIFRSSKIMECSELGNDMQLRQRTQRQYNQLTNCYTIIFRMLFIEIGKYSESFYFFDKFIGDYYLSLLMKSSGMVLLNQNLPLKWSSPISLDIRSRGENILCRCTYNCTCHDRSSVPPLSHCQQEIGDVNQGEVRRGLSV